MASEERRVGFEGMNVQTESGKRALIVKSPSDMRWCIRAIDGPIYVHVGPGGVPVVSDWGGGAFAVLQEGEVRYVSELFMHGSRGSVISRAIRAAERPTTPTQTAEEQFARECLRTVRRSTPFRGIDYTYSVRDDGPAQEADVDPRIVARIRQLAGNDLNRMTDRDIARFINAQANATDRDNMTDVPMAEGPRKRMLMLRKATDETDVENPEGGTD